MSTGLVSALQWHQKDEVWSSSLLCYEENFREIALEPGSPVSFRVLKGRFCTGFTSVSTDTGGNNREASWRVLNPCLERTQIKHGTQCTRCASRDMMRSCLLCNGLVCSAPMNVRKTCKDSVCYVYLASFGSNRIKAGVSQANRITKRWVEQGADMAKRVLRGNGMEVRRYEKQVQDELGALRLFKGNEKMSIKRERSDLERPVHSFNVLEEKIHDTFAEEHHFHEELQILTPIYRLPEIKKRPLPLIVKEGIEVSGRILGVKGPILFLEKNDLILALDLNRLLGRKIEIQETSPATGQTGLDKFLFKA